MGINYSFFVVPEMLVSEFTWRVKIRIAPVAKLGDLPGSSSCPPQNQFTPSRLIPLSGL